MSGACSQILDTVAAMFARLGQAVLDWLAGIPTVRFQDPDELGQPGWPVDLAIFDETAHADPDVWDRLATAPGSSPGPAGAAGRAPLVGGTRADLPQAPIFDRPAYCAYRDVPEHVCVDAFGFESSAYCWASVRRLASMQQHPTSRRGTE